MASPQRPPFDRSSLQGTELEYIFTAAGEQIAGGSRSRGYAGGCRSKSLECPGRWKLRRGTRRSTLMGLLAATGIWVEEVIRLGRDDIDWARGGLAIYEWKCAIAMGSRAEIRPHRT